MVNILILDLDNTLIHSVLNKKEIMYGDFQVLSRAVFKRPHLEKFLDHCFSTFDHVIIWSLGKTNYVHGVLESILHPRHKPLLVYCREDSRYMQGKIIKDTSLLVKPLQKHGIKYRTCNFVFIDDKTHLINPTSNVKVLAIQPFNTKMERRVKTLITCALKSVSKIMC